ncbi:lipid II:glycine glycyltransferase FemX [Arthrobacter sp. NPDC092385]|uniref:lipid II:glycine glycyltransferase FemX n=1 Tax=Arthrobacter sp. NPDC092385 TaxID=3363943 RepID=UPI00380452EE
MTTRFATPDEIARWNSIISENPDGGNVMQGREFAEQKRATGWTPVYLVVDGVALTVLQKTVLPLGRYWYVPKGPGVKDAADLVALVPGLKAFAAGRGVFGVKIDPELPSDPAVAAALEAAGLVRVANVQPNVSTVILDISAELEAIEASFGSKTRYNIRAARKAGVETRVVAVDDENCAIFYRLLAETAEGSFSIRSEEYYTGFWKRHARAQAGAFLFAYVDGDVVSADFIMVLGAKASRKDAASTRKRTVRGASALLEVAAIEWLKARGVTEYDLCGAPPSSEAKNKDHEHYGIGMFKTGFNPTITDFVGTFDLPVRPVQHRAWLRIGERAVLKVHRMRSHESWY